MFRRRTTAAASRETGSDHLPSKRPNGLLPTDDPGSKKKAKSLKHSVLRVGTYQISAQRFMGLCLLTLLILYVMITKDSTISLWTSMEHPSAFVVDVLTSHPRPRMLLYHDNMVVSVSPQQHAHKLEHVTIGHVITAKEEESGDDDDPDADTCQPMHEWQTLSYPVCNHLHELDIHRSAVDASLQFINCGGDRCAFRYAESDRTKPLAIKMRKYRRDFSQSDFEASRIDGMSMERLSASPFVLTTYGYCGLSQLLEFGNGGAIHDLIKRAKLYQKDHIKELGKDHPDVHDFQDPIDRLKIGIHLVTAIADLHSFEKDGRPSLTHNDICCHQFILVDGIYKLNDFHLAKFLKVRKKSGEVCHHYMGIGHHWALIHAPEEIERPSHAVDNAIADDYVIGNVMYYVLAKKWIFEDISNSDGVEKLIHGERSPFPPHIANSTHPADIAFQKGITMLWTHDVAQRPTSRQVSDFLLDELRKITGEADPDLRVNIPPLPSDWDYGDEDFEANFNDD